MISCVRATALAAAAPLDRAIDSARFAVRAGGLDGSGRPRSGATSQRTTPSASMRTVTSRPTVATPAVHWREPHQMAAPQAVGRTGPGIGGCAEKASGCSPGDDLRRMGGRSREAAAGDHATRLDLGPPRLGADPGIRAGAGPRCRAGAWPECEPRSEQEHRPGRHHEATVALRRAAGHGGGLGAPHQVHGPGLPTR